MNGQSGVGSSTDMGDDSGLREMHLRQWFDANVRGVQMMMLGEGKVNGQPIHNSTYLINILKSQYRFAGVLVSSFNGLSSIPSPSLQVQVETVVNAGVDMILAPPGQHVAILQALKQGLQSGTIRMQRVNDAVRRILRAKELSGHFDSPCQPYLVTGTTDGTGNEEAIAEGTGELPSPGSMEHRRLSRTVVQQSLVLLKNGGGGKNPVFPLPPTSAFSNSGHPRQQITLYVGGTHADDIGRQCGGYTITSQGLRGAATEGSTILQGFEEHLPEPSKVIKLAPGEKIPLQRDARPPNTYALLVVGEEPYSGQAGDRKSEELRLAKESEELIEDSCNKVTCIILLITGRPLEITGILPVADAVVVGWLPGTEAGGIADVFLQEDLDFQGTLPLTWFRNTTQIPISLGDKVYNPLFAYGYGLTKGGQMLNGTFLAPT